MRTRLAERGSQRTNSHEAATSSSSTQWCLTKRPRLDRPSAASLMTLGATSTTRRCTDAQKFSSVTSLETLPARCCVPEPHSSSCSRRRYTLRRRTCFSSLSTPSTVASLPIASALTRSQTAFCVLDYRAMLSVAQPAGLLDDCPTWSLLLLPTMIKSNLSPPLPSR
jgi:hypothetical protein